MDGLGRVVVNDVWDDGVVIVHEGDKSNVMIVIVRLMYGKSCQELKASSKCKV